MKRTRPDEIADDMVPTSADERSPKKQRVS